MRSGLQPELICLRKKQSAFRRKQAEGTTDPKLDNSGPIVAKSIFVGASQGWRLAPAAGRLPQRRNAHRLLRMVLSDLPGILSSGFALVYLSRKRCGMRPAVLVTYRPPPVDQRRRDGDD